MNESSDKITVVCARLKHNSDPGRLRSCYFLFVIFGLLMISCSSFAANPATNDSLTRLAQHRANRAALFSAIVPGSGQFYNQKYWKIPLIYGGFGALIYSIGWNNKYFKEYKKAYGYRIDNNPATIDEFPSLTNEDLSGRKDYFRRNRDLCIILSGTLYVLNIIDAYVDSQLRDFDVSDDLTLRAGPAMDLSAYGAPLPGFKLALRFK